VTFTNKAAAEMSARIRTALDGQPGPIWVGTFHGLGARQLRIEPEVAGLRPGFEILDADDSRRLVKRTLKALNLADASDDAAMTGRDPLKVMCRRIAAFKDSLIVPEDAGARVEGMIAQAARTGQPIDVPGMRAAATVYVDYQRRLRDANAADFGDLLLWSTRAMQRNETYRRRWAARFDCLFADEYQDVCFAQYSWLRLLSVDHGRLFVVGDDDQAIFGFRGSDLGFLRRFTNDFPSAVQVRLEENFVRRGISSMPPTPSSRRTRCGWARRCSRAKSRAIVSRSSVSRTPRQKRTASSPRCSSVTPRASAGMTWRFSTAATFFRAESKRL
jgi:DNA helicase-2/ATP-dependent DNA helicase PcrA